MKLVDVDELCKKGYECVASFDKWGEVENCEDLEEIPTVDAIVIPNRATLGDMIKTIFPNAYTGLSIRDNEVYIMNNGERICRFPLDLWYSSYKKGE